jgi:ribosomal protein L29
MAILKIDDIRKMSKSEREKKSKELKIELIKAQTSASKSGNIKTREIKKTIAKILTINESDKEELKNK